MKILSYISNKLRKWFAPDYYLDVYGNPKDYTHITSWPIVPQGMKTKGITFKSFRKSKI